MVALLSQCKGMGRVMLIMKSVNKLCSHTSSLVVLDILLYSASAEDLETVFYFLVFQEMREWPKKTPKPVSDRPLNRQFPQSASQKAVNDAKLSEGKKRPRFMVPLRYLRTCMAAL